MENNFQSKKGFTLVEMIVSVSLFTIVALIVSGVFVTVARANRQAQAIRVLSDNMSFVIDTISYNLKLGGDYRCGSTCEEISFKDLNGNDKSFSKIGDRVFDYDNKPLNTDNIKITYLDFQIKDTGPRPLVNIFLSGMGEVSGNPVSFSLQTSISQRNWVNN